MQEKFLFVKYENFLGFEKCGKKMPKVGARPWKVGIEGCISL